MKLLWMVTVLSVMVVYCIVEFVILELEISPEKYQIIRTITQSNPELISGIDANNDSIVSVREFRDLTIKYRETFK